MTKPSQKERRGLDISTDQEIQTRELHCMNCGRFLGYQAIIWGSIKLKCPKCKEWVSLSITPEE